MNKTNFKDVQDTLFIPLSARILASKKFTDYFYDKKAMGLKI